MQKYHFYIFIIFVCTFALAYRWFSKPVQQVPVQQERTTEIEKPTEPAPFKYTIRKTPTPSPTVKKESMKMQIARDQAQDPSFLPFDSEGSLYVENVIIDGEWAIAYGDQLVGKAEELIRLEQDGGILKIPKPVFWKDGVVPYALSTSIPPAQVAEIKKVMDLFTAKTALTFRVKQSEEDYIVFKSGGLHCYSHVGKIGGAQEVVLAPDCKAPQITHELMHAIGFYHEQSRLDRDEYIMIMWENIEEKFHEQFKKIPPLHFSIEDTDFDIESIMMYPPQAFSIAPGDPSILTINGELYQPQQTLSAKDLEKIEKIYGEKN
ncbi:MAG: hypothetical protein CME71_13090 [Halobacteriovorax sp.]|nr:hypothetical protein [Halobacteriovorax sp.]